MTKKPNWKRFKVVFASSKGKASYIARGLSKEELLFFMDSYYTERLISLEEIEQSKGYTIGQEYFNIGGFNTTSMKESVEIDRPSMKDYKNI